MAFKPESMRGREGEGDYDYDYKHEIKASSGIPRIPINPIIPIPISAAHESPVASGRLLAHEVGGAGMACGMRSFQGAPPCRKLLRAMTIYPEPFLAACRGEKVTPVPIWLMRQAGRYLPEYRQLRSQSDFVTLCKTPAQAAEVTLQPIRRFPLDAAILFSDILLPLEPMGVTVHFEEAPRLEPCIRTREDVRALRVPKMQTAMAYSLEAIDLIRKKLPRHVALIGFAGGPFTLANYLVEGGSSTENLETKQVMLMNPAALKDLLEKLTEQTIDYLKAQVHAGVQALQIFDSSAGVLGPDDFEEFALPYARRVVQAVRSKDIPVIYFARGAGAYIERLLPIGADVFGIDWQTPLKAAWDRLKGLPAIQGNLDPAALLGSQEEIRKRVVNIINEAGDRPGFIFNLGHGVLKNTPPENVAYLVDIVHKISTLPAPAPQPK